MSDGTVSATSMTNPHGEGRFLPGLDGWRALAALMVTLFHGLYNSDLTHYPMLKSLSHHGGSLFFFPLSGYLITSRLYDRSQGRRQLSLGAFTSNAPSAFSRPCSCSCWRWSRCSNST